MNPLRTPLSLFVRMLFLLSWIVALVGLPVNASAAPAASSWILENPTPRSQNLLGLACPDQNTCVAVGGGGLTIATRDGGTSWHQGATGTTASLFSVSCPSILICYASGAHGRILHTLNGGSSWTSVRSPAPRNITGISCPTASACLVADGRHVLRTTNAGRSWTNHTPPGPSWNSVTCASVGVCYAAGGPIVLMGDFGTGESDGVAFTRDIGNTWRVQNTSIQNGETIATAVGCSGRTCLAVGTSASGRYNPAPDGGIVWDVVHHHTGQAVSQWPLRGVACASSAACIAVGDRGTIVRLNSSGHGEMLSTGNPLKDLINLTAVACPTARVCFAVGQTGAIIRSEDAGRDWMLATHAVTYDGLSSVSCAATACYAAGGSTILRRDPDGWSVVRSGNREGFTGISCRTNLVCYAASGASPVSPYRSEILRTTDDGSTWQRVTMPIDGDLAPLSDIACPTTDVCYALGQTNRDLTASTPMFLTVDDGVATDLPLPLPMYGEASHLACPAVDTCLVTYEEGFHGGVIRTSDGGRTWMQVTGLHSNTDYGPITCPDAHTCYAAGVNEDQAQDYTLRAVLVTLHGGARWSERLTSYGNGLNGIDCLTVNSCYAVGSGGRIMNTGDGGRTWQTEDRYSQSGLSLEAVACRTGLECYAVGYPGIILESDG